VDSSDRGQGTAVVSCKHDNDPNGSIKYLRPVLTGVDCGSLFQNFALS
jgi:hypothetical protein